MPDATHEPIERRVAAAHQLVRSFEGREGVVGTFVHGSATRPYGDASSDYDLAVIVDDDAFASIAAEGAHQKIWDAGQRIADVSIYKWSVFENPVVDQEHFRAMHARVLFDRSGELAGALAKLRALPPDAATDRMRVHYFEVTSLAGKLASAQRRAQREAALLLTAQLVHCAGKLLFLSKGAWPSPTTWMFDELTLVGVPDVVVAALHAVVDKPDAKSVRMLRGKLDEYLVTSGAKFVDDPRSLLDWIYESPEGLRAIARWGLATG